MDAQQNALAIVQSNPVVVLTDAKTYNDFYKQIAEEVDGFVPDLTTAKGRKEIAALAFKVVRTKTAIDDAGKKLNEAARAQINAVDAQRRKVRDELDALAERARKPLTEWEEAEEKRIASVKARLSNLVCLGNLTEGTVDELKERLAEAEGVIPTDGSFGEFEAEAVSTQKMTVARLSMALGVAQKREEERAELERLRAEAAERERKDAEERAAREKAEAEARAAAEAEAKKKAEEEEKAAAVERERQRIQQEEKAKADALVREAEEKALAAQREAERVKREADEREQAAAAAEKQKAEAHAAEVLRVERERAAREADREHRSKIMGAAKEGFVGLGVDEDLARKLVLAVVAGEIPNIKCVF